MSPVEWGVFDLDGALLNSDEDISLYPIDTVGIPFSWTGENVSGSTNIEVWEYPLWADDHPDSAAAEQMTATVRWTFTPGA